MDWFIMEWSKNETTLASEELDVEQARILALDLGVGLAYGFVIGLGFMLAWVHWQHERSRERQEKARGIAALSNMKLDDVHKLFPPDYFPYWVVMGRYEKVQWINRSLKKVWPLLSKTTSARLKEAWEHQIDVYRPPTIAQLTFQKFTVGTIAPVFQGVRLAYSNEDEIALDAECHWQGNPSIILKVRTLMGLTFPIQVKDVSLVVVLRFIFRPLVEELPGFGGFTYSIKKKKKLDFRVKVIGGDLSAFPGLAGVVEEMIKSTILDSLMWPMRIPVAVIPSPVDGDFTRLQRHMWGRRGGVNYSSPDHQVKAIGILDVKLVQAKNLLKQELVTKVDAFALLYIRPIPSRMKRSKTIKPTWNDLSPIWNEIYELEVEEPETQKLIVKIFDEDTNEQAEDLLGCAEVPLKDLEPGVISEQWIKLVRDLEKPKEGKYRGEVNLELLYRPYNQSFQPMWTPELPKVEPTSTSLEPAITELPNVDSTSVSVAPIITQVPVVESTSISVPPASSEVRKVESASPSMRLASASGSPRQSKNDLEDPRISLLLSRPPPLHPQFSFQGQLWEIVRGVLSVTVQRAEDLVPADMNGLSDPYVVLKMRKSNMKKQTKVVYKNLNPVWNQTLDFLVEDAIHDMLQIKVWDHDTFGKDFLGKCATTLTKTVHNGEQSFEFTLDGVLKGKLFLHMKWTPQPFQMLGKRRHSIV